MNRLTIPVILLVCIFYFDTNAQQKFERESRIRAEDVSPEALRFIETVEMKTRWKWYFEENLVGNSVEAKTKYKRKWNSVEFDTSGKIQDEEIEIDWQESEPDLEIGLVPLARYEFTDNNKLEFGLDYRLSSFIDGSSRNSFWLNIGWYLKI